MGADGLTEAEVTSGMGLEKQENATKLSKLIRTPEWNNEEIGLLVPEWQRLAGENGYRHNGENLALHTREVVNKTVVLLENTGISERGQNLAIFSAFWHDFGQQTGKQNEPVARDFAHEEKSIEIMRRYGKEWNMADADVEKVEKVIALDGVASDIARGKVRNPERNLTPADMASILENDLETCLILRAVNQADVIATVGEPGWNAIRQKFEEYFDKTEAIILGQTEAQKMEVELSEQIKIDNSGIKTEKIRNLRLDAMQIIDQVRFMPFLGKKDAKTMAGFSRLMREEGQKFEVNRWLGVGWDVDKKDRSNFLRFIREHDSDTLRKLIKINSGGNASNRIFTYSFEQERKGLERLAEDKDLLDFGIRLAGALDNTWLSRYGAFVDEGLDAKLRVIKDYQFSDKLMIEPEIFGKLHEAPYFYPETAGPVFALANYPEALDYLRGTDKEISTDVVPILEFASTDREVFEVVTAFIERSGSRVFMSEDLVKTVIDAAKNSSNPISNKIMELSEARLKELSDNYGSSTRGFVTTTEEIFQGAAHIAAQIKENSVPGDVAIAYLDGFPVESLNFYESGYVVRGGDRALSTLSTPENGQAFRNIQKEFGNTAFLVLDLGIQMAEERNTTLAEVLNDAGNQIKEMGGLEGFEPTMWRYVGDYLGRHPEQTMSVLLLLSEDEVRTAIMPGGILADSHKVFFDGVFGSSDLRATGLEIAHQFSRPNTSYADKVYFYAVHANEDVLEKRVPQVPVVKVSSGNEVIVDFPTLNLEEKKLVLRTTIERVVEKTRSVDEKKAADIRNRNLARTDQLVRVGARLHGSNSANLSRILRSGNFSGECLTKVNEVDSYPFCVDYVGVTEKDAKNRNFKSVLSAKNSEYGVFFEKGMVLILNPSSEVTLTPSGKDHLIKFAAEEATNISGIVLTITYKRDEVLENMKMEIAENGFYIPVYDTEGNVLFTAEEFDKLQRDYHLDINLEYWDGSLKVGESLGSNPGGVYLVPEEGGPKKYYVKHLESRDRVWCESLAGDLYLDYGVAVPDVKVRNVDGRPAVTSRWINSDKDVVGNLRPLKDGFIMDAWMANWDVPWAQGQNTREIDGGQVRLDNGGALLFRAHEGLKDLDGGDSPFTDEVVELTEWSHPSKKGTGMRTMYVGLTNRDIHDQAVRLKEVFTDVKIDQRIERTQMSPHLRKILSQRLKARRDYILKSVGLI
ncbi:MAG: hypothetical protein HYV90_01575 [Candidatus Woesebacteria bacterium]|nr:MAG: hypothetical protein HYV90_01575 [Candidatus Woesebacteria bacterium]